MQAPFWERFMFWICDTFGHRKLGRWDRAWIHDGMQHYDCKRCGRIITKKPPSNVKLGVFERMSVKITTGKAGHDFKTGDTIEITVTDHRKWKRFWHWITFRNPPIKTESLRITGTSTTAMTVTHND